MIAAALVPIFINVPTGFLLSRSTLITAAIWPELERLTYYFLARPRNLWAHREDISSRQAAKNVKGSAALFGRDFKRQCQLLFLASLRLGESKKKLIREKSTQKMCSANVIFPCKSYSWHPLQAKHLPTDFAEEPIFSSPAAILVACLLFETGNSLAMILLILTALPAPPSAYILARQLGAMST